jgi:uncharacterized protein YodC (DUF2158 family)
MNSEIPGQTIPERVGQTYPKYSDRVVLSSGGPVMTVVRYEPSDSDEVVCQWFYKDKLEEKAFHHDVLRPDTPLTFFSI